MAAGATMDADKSEWSIQPTTQRRFLPFLRSQDSLPGVQFKTLARSMNSSLVMSPRANRSARMRFASASGERLVAHAEDPSCPFRTRKNNKVPNTSSKNKKNMAAPKNGAKGGTAPLANVEGSPAPQ
jgi:hypothetical protein